jgi:hypothetical protein
MNIWESVVENKIQTAMTEGAFDNLPGKGKPIQWPEESSDPTWTLAHQLLKANGFAPEWIEDHKAIEDAERAARERLARAWQRHLAERAADPAGARARWQRALAEFARRAAQLNRQIVNFNLRVPLVRFQRTPISVERELVHLNATA